ncbi:MAG: class I SAM-dependent methyltransferase [Chloroflexota bacterium]
MKCCGQCQGIEQIFDSKVAREDLKQYRKNGPTKATRVVLDWLESLGQNQLSLLDVGGGVGIIQHELFKVGVVNTAVHVDAAQSFLQASKSEAERLGHAEQVTYQHGNFVELANALEPADIVTLDRVLCCYHDMPGMVRATAVSAKKYIGLIFPQDRFLFKLGVKIANLGLLISRNPFRIFIHPTQTVDALLNEHGFQRKMHKKFLFWQSMVYVKQAN